MSRDSDDGNKKGTLGKILLILHLVAVIGIISFLHTKYSDARDAFPKTLPTTLLSH